MSTEMPTLRHLVLRRLEDVTGPFGISFDPDAPESLALYAALTIVVNGFIPVPLAAAVCVVGVLLYGWWLGFLINLVCSVAGCFLSFVLCRLFRPFFLRLLGSKADIWTAMDAAITREGYKIPLLLRLTPVMPVVLTNAMLSLTSVDALTFTWTTFVGFIPSGVPYAYAAVVGEQVMNEFPPRDPLLLGISVLGLVATLLVVYKIGQIAAATLAELGVGTSGPADGEVGAPSASKVLV